MASSFDGINTALTSLYAQRRGLDVTGRNILPKTIMEMQLQQASYQAALAAGARVIQPSLIDFLR